MTNSALLTHTLLPIQDMAGKLALLPEEYECIGNYGAKLRLDLLENGAFPVHGKLVLVTAITPTTSGEGKTVVSIGLALGLARVGQKSILKHALTSCALACCLSAACSAQTERFVDVLGTGNITTTTRGTFTNGMVIRQSNRSSAGIASAYEMWRGANGIVGGVSHTPTNSSLWSLTGKQLCTWPIDRYKLDFQYERRLRPIRAIHPYVGAGAFVAVLWGGDAPAHSGVNASGFDAIPGAVVTVGANTRLTSRLSLKTGLLVDFAKASTYSDQSYRSEHNLMFEPQIGLSWRMGKAGRP